MKGRALTIGATVLAAWCCAAENDARGDQGSGAPAPNGGVSRAAAGPLLRVGVLSYCPASQPQYQPVNATTCSLAMAGSGLSL
jgi:hypothetical protein